MWSKVQCDKVGVVFGCVLLCQCLFGGPAMWTFLFICVIVFLCNGQATDRCVQQIQEVRDQMEAEIEDLKVEMEAQADNMKADMKVMLREMEAKVETSSVNIKMDMEAKLEEISAMTESGLSRAVVKAETCLMSWSVPFLRAE